MAEVTIIGEKMQDFASSMKTRIDSIGEKADATADVVSKMAVATQRQAVEITQLSDSIVKSEGKIMGMQAAAFSVLEGRMRAFVKAEMSAFFEEYRLLPRLKFVEGEHRKLCDAMGLEVQSLREAIEVLSESLGLQVDLGETRVSRLAEVLPPSPESTLAASGPFSPSSATLSLGESMVVSEPLSRPALTTRSGGRVSNPAEQASLREPAASRTTAEPVMRHRSVIGDLAEWSSSREPADGRPENQTDSGPLAIHCSGIGNPAQQTSSQEHVDGRPGRGSVRMSQSQHAETALITAIVDKDPERALASLWESNAQEVAAVDRDGCTALHRSAATAGMSNVIALLLEHGGVRLSSMRDYHMRTALHHAALAGNASACVQLMNSPNFSETDRRSLHGRTALHLAAECGHSQASRALLDHARFTMVDAVDDWGHTGLHHAAMHDHPVVCQVLLEHGRFQAAGAKDKDGWTALHWAASGGHATVCQVLLASPAFAEIAAITARGWTALHLAAAQGFEEAVHVLISHRRFADHIHTQDVIGRNALHAAAEAGQDKVCRLFTAHESFALLVGAKDFSGNTPNDLATGKVLEVPLHVRIR
eukprot:TRINITY_DN11607_c0_g2_i1.p1 TRINITY_DN11607_c0_g2~~TRINITY_DN11607_c0_g2_i1.p1  ORF type:complete len:593 (-),score=123.86 TRINITY_DN11607_c0_g2_i1:186-1964(-)